jgi:hypothetical protein
VTTIPAQAPTWTPPDIVAVADVLRAYLRDEMPDEERMFFNSDVEEMAIRVWPVIAEQVRAKMAAEATA